MREKAHSLFQKPTSDDFLILLIHTAVLCLDTAEFHGGVESLVIWGDFQVPLRLLRVSSR